MSEAPSRPDFDRVMVPCYAPSDFVPVRGEGARVWDQSGREFIDFGGGIAVTSLGHAHPALVAALTEQAGKLWHVSNVYTNEPALRLAERLVQHTFAERVFFANSGAEANEAALKLARRVAFDRFGEDKYEILSFEGSFHGRTFFTVSVGGQAKYSSGFGPRPEGIRHLKYNDLASVAAAISKKTCAVIVEPVIGEGGVIPATPEFLQGLRELTRANDALLIFDEVQSGVGRTGKLYGYELYGVVPDILTSAKGLGGGIPIGAMLTAEQYAKHFSVGVHGTTFGGNPLACAVADKVIEIVSNPEVLAGVTRRADAMAARLNAIAQETGAFKELRNRGLWFGWQLKPEHAGRAKDVLATAAKEGLMLLVAGPDVVRMSPSLVISEADMNDGLERLARAVKSAL
ncbi:acetylornithine/succinyldiaminopimelate transaminase [Niveibacterium sp. SC-1]|uniref:acetylornithine/succinyldiaminopimelate transaminase n=1 Tax=Niveibacterium sp. SC-1 TaxID=3135646 RepID=UPI00311EB62C